ncbi:MAG: leucyl aminopeptidase [Desulfamplus sp.]|nr:leucyl aminopeptidase [Desulfamplus sp.]
MKIATVTLIDKNIEKFNEDILVYFIPQEKNNKFEYLTNNSSINDQIDLAYKLGDFSGKEGQTLLLYPFDYMEESKENNITLPKRILAVGIGKININNDSKLNDYNEFVDILRKAGGSVSSIAAKVKAKTILVSIPDIANLINIPSDSENLTGNNLANNRDKYIDIDASAMNLPNIAQYIAEGILLGDYLFLKYKKEKPDEPHYNGLAEIKFYLENFSNSSSPSSSSNYSKTISKVRKSLKRASISAQAVYKARDMGNEPANEWRASDFAAYATKLAKKYKLNCTIIDKEKMKELGMGGIIAVNQGSSEPPKMVILEYQPKKDKVKSKKHKDEQNSNLKQEDVKQNQNLKEEGFEEKRETILLVGKGITFDSGGICLKQPTGMEDMKYDMCGGAAVLAVMQAVAQEMPNNIGVVAIVPATDNLSGGAAVKPGDIIRHYNGVTSEIINTDAEGRMVLADAIAYGIETFKPVCVVDIATLTGAAIIGLGHHYSAILGNNDELIKRLVEAANRAGEPLWRLPLGKEYTKQIESKVADIKNAGGKAAGTITAAAYLEHFVGKTPWAHIDIAGTAWEFTEKNYIPKGASGIGVRTFLELIRNWQTSLT